MNLRKNHFGTAALVLAAMGSFAVLRSARGDSLADHVPDDALVYVEWSGTAALSGAYEQSHMKALVDLFDVSGRIHQAMNQAAAGNDPADRQRAAEALDLLNTLAAYPTALYVGPVDFSKPEKPGPKLALISKVGTGGADIAARLKKLNDAAPDATGNPNISAIGDYLVITLGKGMDAAAWLSAAGPAKKLSDSPRWKTTMADVDAGSSSPAAARIFVNAEAVFQTGLEAAQSTSDPEIAQMIPLLLDILGVQAVKSVGWTGRFDGPNWSAQAFVGLEGKRHGLIGLFDVAPLPEDAYRVIPANVAWAAIGRFDANRFLDDVRAGVQRAMPQQASTFDMVLRQFYAFTGVDLQKDLFACLGDTYTFYAVPDSAGKVHGYTVINTLKDPDKAQQVFSQLEQFSSAMLSQRGGNVKFTTEPLAAPNEKISAHIISFQSYAPAWTIANGRLYISGSKAELGKALSISGNGLLDNAKFAGLRKKLGQKAVAAFTYDDTGVVVADVYAYFRPQFDKLLAQQNPPMAPLPSTAAVVANLEPAMSVLWSDAQGVHFRGIGPVPGWEEITPQWKVQEQLSRSMTGQATTAP